MANFYEKEGLKFSCVQCHDCCRHDPGFVFLSKNDLDRLLKPLPIDAEDFIEKYCRWVKIDHEERLSLLEKKNFDCIFWDQGCTVYETRPLQCRTYPFWKGPLESLDTWNWEQQFCPGIGKGRIYSPEEIRANLEKREKEGFLTKTQFLKEYKKIL